MKREHGAIGSREAIDLVQAFVALTSKHRLAVAAATTKAVSTAKGKAETRLLDRFADYEQAATRPRRTSGSWSMRVAQPHTVSRFRRRRGQEGALRIVIAKAWPQ